MWHNMTAHQRLQIAASDPELAPYISGSTEKWSASVVCAFAWSIDARDVLELGAFEGLTTFKLAHPFPEAMIYAVEHDETRANVVRKRCADQGARNVQVIQRDAIAFLRECIDLGRVFDFAFVDDDHTYAHVAEEIDLLKHIVRPGGLIVMHDVIGAFGLDQLVWHHGGRIIELPLLHAAGGLGVLRV